MGPTPQEERDYAAQAAGLDKKDPALPEPVWKGGDDFFKQRKLHRECLFWFAIAMSILSLLGLFGLVMWQGIMRVLTDPSFEILSDTALNILAVSVFGQIFGVVYVIAKSVWSNDEFGLMKNGK